MIDKIKFSYADNVLSSKEREQFMTRQLNIWLSDFEEKINDQEGEIEVFFKQEPQQNVSFDNIQEPLKSTLYKHMEKFQ